jgi:hypothetical protein
MSKWFARVDRGPRREQRRAGSDLPRLPRRGLAALVTDMRATERLLEVIGEQAELMRFRGIDAPELLNILDAFRELRRRGDTLVRRDDLIKALEYVHLPNLWDDGWLAAGDAEGTEHASAAIDRLEIALGGKLR